jgi:hypothetical protein
MSESSPNVFPFVLRSDHSDSTLIASVYSGVNKFSISISQNDTKLIHQVTAQNTQVKFLIGDSTAANSGDVYTTISSSSQYVDNNAFTFNLCNTGSKGISNDFEYSFANGVTYSCKLVVTFMSNVYFACAQLTYYSDLPSLSLFQITQAVGSTNFEISGLLMDHLPGGAYPSFMSAAFDKLEGTTNTNNDDLVASADLFMDSDGSGVVDTTQDSTMIPASGSTNTNNGNYTISTSLIPALAATTNTGFYVSVAASLGDGYSYSFSTPQSVKVFNLNKVIINSVSAYDASVAIPAEAETQPLMSVSIQTVKNGNPYWGNYTPSQVTFELSRRTSSFTYSTPYLNTVNNLDPIYDIMVADMVPSNGDKLLNGGAGYSLKVTVEWVNGTAGELYAAMVETERSTIYNTLLIFNQSIEPVINLQATNAWVALSMDNSDLITDTTPNAAIMVSFQKTAQFNSAIPSEDLDVSSTQFKVEVKIGNSGSWTPVKSASIAQAAFITGGSLAQNITTGATAAYDAYDATLSNLVDGKISMPTSQGGIGTSQPPVWLYIPSNVSYQFADPSQVSVRVSIYSTSASYKPNYSIPASASLYIQNKPGIYAIHPFGAFGEPYVNPIAPFTAASTVPVYNNGAPRTILNVDVFADSNYAMVTQTNAGWLVKADGTTITTYPGSTKTATQNKVNLYYLPPDTESTLITIPKINEGVGFYTLIYVHPDAKMYPFLMVYTTIKPGGPVPSINKAGWYNERFCYGVSSSSQPPSTTPLVPTQFGWTLIYTGDTAPNADNLPPNTLVLKATLDSAPFTNAYGGSYVSTGVGRVALSTSSSSPQDYNFTVAAAGISGPDYNWNVNFGLTHSIPVTPNSESSLFAGVQVLTTNPSFGFTQNMLTSTSLAPVTVTPQVDQYMTYKIKEIYSDLNNVGQYLYGPSSASVTFLSKGIPSVKDYSVTPSSDTVVGETVGKILKFTTVNNNGVSSISFDLNFAPVDGGRIDGVLVYFESSASHIPKTQIADYTTSGYKTIQLLGSGGVLTALGLTWGEYTKATITFTVYRDQRAISANAKDVLSSASSISDTSLVNVPVIPRPSVDGVSLLGGIICNSSTLYTTSLNWVRDPSQQPFTYAVSLNNDTTNPSPPTPTPVTFTDNSTSALLNAVLNVDPSTSYTYTATITKQYSVTSGSSSPSTYTFASVVDSVTFTTAIVNTSTMVINVENPSTTSSLKVSWDPYVNAGSNPANIIYVKLVDTSFTPYKLINPNGGDIETSPGVYNLLQSNPPYALGSSINLGVEVRANVNYVISPTSGTHSAFKSSYTTLSITPSNIVIYTVSSIPNMSLSMVTNTGTVNSTSTILVQQQGVPSNLPSIALNLNANGQENQGFISLVLILTQDGTPEKPSGVETILQFPSTPSSYNPFAIQNITASGSPPSANLIGGESSTVSPLNINPLGLSNPTGLPPPGTTSSPALYTLTIGNQGSPTSVAPATGTLRYWWSYLTLPPASQSGFQSGQEINMMGILTTSKGTDIMIGSVMYYEPIVASGVSIIQDPNNGLFYLQFTLR